MRVVLHAGLHKSGTTSVQYTWRKAFRRRGEAWYPYPQARGLPGHHALFFPHLTSFRDAEAADLVWPREIYEGDRDELGRVLQRGERAGVGTVLFSTEELDRVQEADLAGLREAFAGHEVTVVLTATRPVHRFVSGWQTMVRRGFHLYPADLPRPVLDYTTNLPGRLQEIVELFAPWPVHLHLVRTDPPELELPRVLAETCGVAWPTDFAAPRTHNESVGADVEILRRLNAADLTLGTSRGPGSALLQEMREAREGYVERPELADRYALPEELWRSAAREREWLDALASGPPTAPAVHLHDPHDLRATWEDRTPSTWYAEASRRESVLPRLDALPVLDPGEAVYRARQHVHGLEVRAGRLQARVDELARDNAELAERVAGLERERAQARDRAQAHAQAEAEARARSLGGRLRAVERRVRRR